MILHLKRLLFVAVTTLPLLTFSQILTSNGALVQINGGAVVTCNGGVTISNASNVTNNGQLRTTKNSTLAVPGTLGILSGSSISGNGAYWVEQDWLNDATFNAGSSVVQLYGNSQQFISSSNSTITEFNDLVLTGNGVGADRKKSLLAVDARISTTGTLDLNDRELETQDNLITVLNTSVTAVSNNQTFGSEGFVSSDNLGYMIWNTQSTNVYLFPVGSSLGTLRYRPAVIQPESASANGFAVRLNNSSANGYGYILSQHDPEISTANDLYFHSIEQLSGASNANVEIAYLPSTDGDWSSMAHWKENQALWNAMGETDQLAIGNYSTVSKLAWDFPDVYHPYVLTTITEEIIIPNVFTPNEDGVNDTYFITAKGLKEFNMVIVNRWGNVVFESDDVQFSWDGTTNGDKCGDGTYFYIITAKSATKDYKKQGHITINGSL